VAAFSLGTFFIAVDKESASPVGARTHYQQHNRIGKGKIPLSGRDDNINRWASAIQPTYKSLINLRQQA
jgi:hypothetical protein